MNIFNNLLGKVIDMEISGGHLLTGILIDYGQDIFVIYNGDHFLYIPLLHVQYLNLNVKNDTNITSPSTSPFDDKKELTYRTILNNAKGGFVEISIGEKISIHGYLVNVLVDYFIFYSPVYKTMFVPLFHLKWLIPYHLEQIPYALDSAVLPLQPSPQVPIMRTFKEQLKRMEGKLVVFDQGLQERKIGLLKRLENDIAELITAKGRIQYWNVQHLKSVHFPNM
ncbi:DUF2642 domain-containing protein [Bacillaceae bacterium]